MKKILALSLVAIGLIAADVPLKINGKVVMERHPLPFNVLSQESGGPLSAIDAYSDGIGVLLVNSPTGGIQIDNSGLNSLVYKYGDAAKALDAPLKDYVLMNGSDEEKLAANLLEDERVNGNSCDDGNPGTVNDVWSNGLCIGINAVIVADIKSAYFSNDAKNSGRALINDIIYTWDGTYWRNPSNIIQRYSDIVDAYDSYVSSDEYTSKPDPYNFKQLKEDYVYPQEYIDFVNNKVLEPNFDKGYIVTSCANPLGYIYQWGYSCLVLYAKEIGQPTTYFDIPDSFLNTPPSPWRIYRGILTYDFNSDRYGLTGIFYQGAGIHDYSCPTGYSSYQTSKCIRYLPN